MSTPKIIQLVADTTGEVCTGLDDTGQVWILRTLWSEPQAYTPSKIIGHQWAKLAITFATDPPGDERPKDSPKPADE